MTWKNILILNQNLDNLGHYSPVHKERKFLLVLGQTSEKSWQTMRPTVIDNNKKSQLIIIETFYFEWTFRKLQYRILVFSKGGDFSMVIFRYWWKYSGISYILHFPCQLQKCLVLVLFKTIYMLISTHYEHTSWLRCFVSLHVFILFFKYRISSIKRRPRKKNIRKRLFNWLN